MGKNENKKSNPTLYFVHPIAPSLSFPTFTSLSFRAWQSPETGLFLTTTSKIKKRGRGEQTPVRAAYSFLFLPRGLGAARPPPRGSRGRDEPRRGGQDSESFWGAGIWA